MGLFTLITVVIVILAIIGLGWQVFLSGVTKGAEKVLSNPAVKNASSEAKEFLSNVTNNVTKGIGKELIPNTIAIILS
jgi:hypothetical protein